MFKVNTDLTKDNYAKLSIEPLEAGFGHTLGNAIRRVLLSSLDGAAITSVKIAGIAHQFSAIDGVSEDAIEIILNLKQVRVRLDSDKGVKLILKVTGKKEVTAKDIEVVGAGEVVNPDQHIATLGDAKAKLNIEMSVEKGKGYSKAEERKSDEIGLLSVDAIFSPIMAVNYDIEPTRVGRSNNYDKLTLEVTTDGTITPKAAVEEAARILSNTFKAIYEPEESVEEQKVVSTSASDEILKLTVDELDLPVRITNALRAIDVNTVEELVNVSRGQLLKAKNLGSKSLGLVAEKLAERGLSLREA